MRKICFLLFLTLLFICTPLFSQQKKLLVQINSIKTNEVIELKYNNKSQLIYFDEKGVATYREFTFKYDKNTGQMAECQINQENGQYITNMKFSYDNTDYIVAEVKNSGKKVNIKSTDYEKIYTDINGRLIKTVFDDGKVWEEFEYDQNNNINKYTQHSALGDSDVVTTNTYNDNKSIFSDIEGIPSWFWALNMNNMKWCSDFIGKNNLIESTVIDPRFGTEITNVKYDYDEDGYPLRQYYNDILVKEFKYKN